VNLRLDVMFMDTQKRLELIKEVGEEIVTEGELIKLLRTKAHPVAYDGFEPSGRIHVAQGILRAININKMLKAGVRFKMLVADWHGWANNKLGGDLEKIEAVGDYMLEVWKAAGMKTERVDFVRSSDLLGNDSYWKTVMQVARNSTVKRIVRCAQIMGRKESELLSASQILYPCMQAADIFELKADITQLGLDQRKVNMLAREIGPKLGFWKPVVVSHHMLMGLGQPPKGGGSGAERAIEMKMSKSSPDSAIWMDDSEKEIRRKISKAYCPEKQVEENPIMEYCRYMIFERFKSLEVERPAKFGGNLSIGSYDELVKVYSAGKLHPMDLKNAAAARINELVAPVRKHFEKNAKAKKLLSKVKGFSVIR
jgi:tyrosyl-tRNA synthetase